jgi:hypothetical protein
MIAMEIWTAKEIEIENGEELIVFEIKEKETGKIRIEKKYKSALPLLFTFGGYPAVMGAAMAMTPLPWRFAKHSNGHIYIEDESHPIID